MDPDFELVKRRIAQVKGFDCSEYRESFLRRRIEIRMRAAGAATLHDYCAFLEKNPREYDSLVEALTIHITKFFRDEAVFDFFAKSILPELLWEKQKAGKKVLRVWSAGCAGGEEAYSIAILLCEQLDLRLNDFIITVLGTDIDPESIAKADSGIFPSSELVDVKTGYIEKYFAYVGGGKCRVSPQVRRLVKFRAQDFLLQDHPKYCDVVFCRNALIYLDHGRQKRLFENFFNALNPGGILVLGTTETVLGEASKLFATVSAEHHVYRKAT